MFKGVVTDTSYLTPRKLKSYKFTIPTLSDIQAMDASATLTAGSVLGAYEISVLGKRSPDGMMVYTDVISTLTGLRDYWAAGNTSVTVNVPPTTESYLIFSLLVTKSCKHTAIVGGNEMPGYSFVSKTLELTFLDDSKITITPSFYSEQFTNTSNANYDLYSGSNDPCPDNSCTTISSPVNYASATTPTPTTAPTSSGSTPIRYTYGLPAVDKYNFVVSHGDTYDAGVSMRNDVTSTSTNKKGIRINHTVNNNSTFDLRSSTGAVNSLAFRLQDDASPSSYSNMLSLTDDDKSSTSVYGANVTGRVKASQYFVGESDTRAPTSTGLYVGQDNSSIGYFNMNAGASGTGGFKFSTLNSDGSEAAVNLHIQKTGNIIVPAYAATNNSLDSEARAFAAFNAEGQLVRDYDQNARLRSTEARIQALETSNSSDIPNKVNEIISRINSVAFFNTNVTPLDTGTAPTPYLP